MKKIYVWAEPVHDKMDMSPADFSKGVEYYFGDVIGRAVDEDGNQLASHLSSSYGFFRLDMGLTSKNKHDKYNERYPEGVALVEITAEEIRKQHPDWFTKVESQ